MLKLLFNALQWHHTNNESLKMYESAEGQVLTQVAAMALVKRHNVDVLEFFEECGLHSEYDAQDVLAWLGY